MAETIAGTESVGRLPNFLVIGAGKSGTTSLHLYLSQHPDVFMSSEPRESNFFALEGTRADYRGPDGVEPFMNKVSITELERYRAQFADAGSCSAVGEKCPLYLYDPRAPGNIRRHLGEPKLVAILRNPVQRAWSAWMHARRGGGEPLGFEEALAAEPDRIASNWGTLYRYRDLGYYHRQLARYTDLFDRESIRVVLFEDFRSDPEVVVQEIYEFLGVDPGFVPDVTERRNVGGLLRSRTIQRILDSRSSRLKRVIKAVTPAGARRRVRHMIRDANLRRPTMSARVRRDLADGYREDVEALGELIGRDLSSWVET